MNFEIVDAKLSALVLELKDADWSTENIVGAIDRSLRTRWLNAIEKTCMARASTSGDFVSDGNEG